MSPPGSSCSTVAIPGSVKGALGMYCKTATAYWYLGCCSSVPYFSKHVTAGHTERSVTLGHFLKIRIDGMSDPGTSQGIRGLQSSCMRHCSTEVKRLNCSTVSTLYFNLILWNQDVLEMMHSLFLLQQSIWEFRQLPACHLQSWECGLQFLTAAPVKRILSLEWRCGRTTETVRHFYQKALKSSRKPQVGTEDQEDHFCHTAVQTSNTQGLFLRSRALPQTPHTATQDREVVIVEFGDIAHLQHPQGLRLPHASRRSKIYSTHIIKHLHPPGCSPWHLHRSFPSHSWAGRGCEEDHP